ncbi:endonuclease domain-containing protein [Microbacterium sp. A93]|uniref:endonuclease domain-containing protein n=1 Tax=Microbacterium sp. A93 TaxID=3450716 RepID=UPI003F6DCD4D
MISRGIRQRRDQEVDFLEHLVALQHLHPLGVFSHETAAALWGIWLPIGTTGCHPIHLSKASQAGGPPRRRRVKGHLLPVHAPIKRYQGVRVTGPAWTWVELAATGMEFDDLVAAGDSLLQSKDGPAGQRNPGLHPLSSIQAMEDAICRRPGFRGLSRAREAITWLRPGSDSPQESRLRVGVIQAGFPEPAVNPEVELSTGEKIRPDLVWEDVKICLQYEGDHHRSDADQWDRDIQRDLRMQRDGWIVIRVTKKSFTRVGWEELLENLRLAFASRGGC